jgi:hypothetical protein
MLIWQNILWFPFISLSIDRFHSLLSFVATCAILQTTTGLRPTSGSIAWTPLENSSRLGLKSLASCGTLFDVAAPVTNADSLSCC